MLTSHTHPDPDDHHRHGWTCTRFINKCTRPGYSQARYFYERGGQGVIHGFAFIVLGVADTTVQEDCMSVYSEKVEVEARLVPVWSFPIFIQIDFSILCHLPNQRVLILLRLLL